MYTDLFRALLNRNNARGHPILSALVYAFCPCAAHWWLAGADPNPPFDPVWQALQDRSSGGTLLSHLQRHGFEFLLEDVRQYVQEVRAYRDHHAHLRAPELLPQFPGRKLNGRYGHWHCSESFGGDWENLNQYVRTWAFLINDWREKISPASNPSLAPTCEPLALTLPGVRLPALFDAWVWRDGAVHIGLLVPGKEQDALRFALMERSNPPGDRPWPNLPRVVSLEPLSGASEKYEHPLRHKDLERLVQALARLANNGPHPPLNALQHPDTCLLCGYHSVCFETSSLAAHALSSLEPRASGSFSH